MAYSICHLQSLLMHIWLNIWTASLISSVLKQTVRKQDLIDEMKLCYAVPARLWLWQAFK